MPQRRNECGAVTAETAAVIPVLVLLTAVLAWMVAFGVTQVRATDAARETARALARGDDETTSIELGQRIAPRGARLQVRNEGETVVVVIRADVHGPGGIFGFVPGHEIRAEAVAVRESAS